jgi:hypothetical protein
MSMGLWKSSPGGPLDVHGHEFGCNREEFMTDHNDVFEVVEVSEPTVVVCSMSFVAVDEDVEDSE